MPNKECLDRRAKLTDDDIDYIAEKIEQKMYQNIGKGVVNRFLWIVGIITVSVGAYLKSKGIL